MAPPKSGLLATAPCTHQLHPLTWCVCLQVLPALAPSSNQIPQAAEAQAVVGQPVLEEEPGDEEAMKKALMPRKHRIAYESIQRSRKAKRARVAELEAKRDKLVQPAA